MTNKAKKYLHAFTFVVIVLALVRCVTGVGDEVLVSDNSVAIDSVGTCSDSVIFTSADSANVRVGKTISGVKATGVSTTPFVPHPIYSVPSFKNTFPDNNDVQLISARKYGVSPVADRHDAERRMDELVYVAANPYFRVDKLSESIPYLVPRASLLLQEIGQNFYDSLYVKGIPLHQILVSSVLRTEADVKKLRTHNLNASENSCHRFGTTFDICYNRYVTVETDSFPRRSVQNDTLKWVLSEVLRDLRQRGRCHVKYEVKQGCFHITIK